jgi:RNA polymerase sigma-70 factor (ECF subfamily)
VVDSENPKEVADKELVAAALISPDEFGEIVARYWNRLFAYVRRTTYFTQEDIEDVLQEVFVKVYRFLNDYDNSMTFSTWIYQIARNTIIDEIRKRKARPESVRLENEELLKFFRSGIDLKREIEAGDSLEKIKKIMDDLPFKYREALVLRFLEEKTYEEIMDILKLPKGTVAALVSRGRQMVIAEAKKQNII